MDLSGDVWNPGSSSDLELQGGCPEGQVCQRRQIVALPSCLLPLIRGWCPSCLSPHDHVGGASGASEAIPVGQTPLLLLGYP